ncbi:MAG: VPGUxxT family thioredoxin-like (seleno)protein, type 2 [Saprospiraceae bacterium]
MRIHFNKIAIFILLANVGILFSQTEELGKVNWGRDLEIAKIESKKSNKDILILFQEIPGCSTCKNYGNHVLSHPLLTEAIEDNFIPVVIHNNKSGIDKEVLNFFNEPAWNNPVVRIVDYNLKDVGERLSGNYTRLGLLSRINSALLKKNLTLPKYLKLLEEEFIAESVGIKTAYVGMYCFWSGEKCYAQAKGVVATKAGYMNGSEVVQIAYNPNATTLEKILEHGEKMQCADKIFKEASLPEVKTKISQKAQGQFRVDKESKYYIYNSNYKFLPMTELQASKINLALAENKSVDEFLSPRQIVLYNKINSSNKKFDNLIGRPIEEVWYKM